MASTYLFVDGGHLRKHYAECMQKWTGGAGALNLERLKGQVGAQKCFFYDCIDDIRREGETDAVFSARVTEQEEYFDRLTAVYGTHLRLGSMTGTMKKRRQKQVDILLAVDAMSHAARGNMAQFILLSGDQDFKPLVESLVQMGLFVHVLGDRRHTSRALTREADHHHLLTLTDYMDYSDPILRETYPIGGKSKSTSGFGAEPLIRSGTIAGREAKMHYDGHRYAVSIRYPDGFMNVTFTGTEERCSLFCELEFGEVIWK